MTSEEGRTCSKCSLWKERPNFSAQARGQFGLRSVCKACQATIATERHYANRDAELKRMSEYGKRTRPARTAAKRVDYLKRKYNVTPDWVDQTLLEQGGCGICGTTTPGGKRGTFHVDHAHDTNQTRGVLCHHCNVGIGMLKDSPIVLASAITYLVKHGQAYPTEALAALLPPPL